MLVLASPLQMPACLGVVCLMSVVVRFTAAQQSATAVSAIGPAVYHRNATVHGRVAKAQQDQILFAVMSLLPLLPPEHLRVVTAEVPVST